MKKLVAIRSQARALTQPPRKSPPAKAPPAKAPPSKAEVDFDRAVQFRKTCPLLAAAPAAQRRMRAAALAYAAELAPKGGKR